jgi:hypothetical protein
MASAGILFLSGCGTPGAPMPPSLKLPDPVTDLSAVRTGNQVSLTWTMPRKNTDKLLLKGELPVRICRKESSGACVAIPSGLSLAPGADGEFTDTLPAALASGPPRPLTYFVDLKNQKGRSAGPSNEAQVLAGQAPGPVEGLAAEVRKAGVALRWSVDSSAETSQPSPIAMRLHRTLLTPQPVKTPAQPGVLAPAPEPVERTLLVDAAQSGRALDRDIRFGETYEYRAQRIARVSVSGQTIELAGAMSAPIRLEVKDIFPPAIPTGLAAVATPAENGSDASIDLSWQPVTDTDLAGYAVYRREGEGAWERISPAQPVVGPGFHDAHTQPGHTYRYAVTAIDQLGHESPRSAETEESVPVP